MYKLLCLFSVLLLSGMDLFSQERDSATGYFLVEAEQFTPPESALIEHYEGRPAMAFMANDMDGAEQYLGDYIGKKVLLWFWNTSDDLCLQWLPILNQCALVEKHVQILSFADQSRAEMTTFLADVDVEFPIIPNANVFGELAYAADLGYPRMFLINEDGIIKKVFPKTLFEHKSAMNLELQDIFSKL